jgi:hypothetical protein
MASMSKPLEVVTRTFRITFTCPINAKPFAEVVPGSVAPLSVGEEVMIEAGRRLFLESVEVSRDFARQMITVSSGAVPIYVALLGIAGPAAQVSFLVGTYFDTGSGISFLHPILCTRIATP